MIRMGVSGWVFLLVPAYPGSPGPTAVKRLCVCVWKGLYAEVIVYKQWEIDEHEVACVYRDKYQVHV